MRIPSILARLCQRNRILGCLSLGLAVHLGCAPTDDTGEESAGAAVTNGNDATADQGWSKADADWFDSTSQGSHIVPYAWFLHLENADSKEPLRSSKTIGALGYLTKSKDATNPDAMPVGFVKDADPKTGDWLGLTCAACHTNRLEHGGKSVRIDGDGGLGDVGALIAAIDTSLQATLADASPGGKLERFSDAVLGTTRKNDVAARRDLRAEIGAFSDMLHGYVERSRPARAFGFSRIDSFGLLINEITGTTLGLPENYEQPAAPLKNASIWEAGTLDWQTSNASVNNAIARMCLEAVGVFAEFSAETTAGGPPTRMKTSIRTQNLHEIDKRLRSLKAPRWPSAIFGDIDQERAQAGAALFIREKCDTCHGNKPPYATTPPNAFGKQFTRITRVPVADVGTDASFVDAFVGRTGKTGPLAPLFNGSERAGSLSMARALVGIFLKSELASFDLAPQELADYAGFHEPEPPPAEVAVYKAKPLAGVWASAPFLHNGSVPNLHELLLPPTKRSKRWRTGSHEFDVVNVGFGGKTGSFELDTSVPGSSNAGHDYGTNISESERLALIEYVKTL